MKITKLIIATLALSPMLASLSACDDLDDDNNISDEYKEWAETNQNWLNDMANRRNADGTPYYKKVLAPWDAGSYVLIHYFENPEENADKLTPLYNSYVDVRHTVSLYNDSIIDSSADSTSPDKGVFRSQLSNSGLITGWKIALTDMHVGDTAEVIMPYNCAYGTTGYDNIPPYTNLRFGLRLVDIPYYETIP